MNTLNDNIIQEYISHPKTDDAVQRPCFRELSTQFHNIFRQNVARAVLRGWIRENPEPVEDFWSKWASVQENEEN